MSTTGQGATRRCCRAHVATPTAPPGARAEVRITHSGCLLWKTLFLQLKKEGRSACLSTKRTDMFTHAL